MILRNRLGGLSWPVLVEVAYLAGRYISHGLTWDVFQRQLQSDVRTPHRRQAIDIVRSIIGDIETAEQTDIHSLPPERRLAYLSSLDDLVRKKTRFSAENDEVEATLADLRATR
jgi:hypothetical protein